MINHTYTHRGTAVGPKFCVRVWVLQDDHSHMPVGQHQVEVFRAVTSPTPSGTVVGLALPQGAEARPWGGPTPHPGAEARPWGGATHPGAEALCTGRA